LSTKLFQQPQIITYTPRQKIIHIKTAKTAVKIPQSFAKTVKTLKITLSRQHQMKEHAATTIKTRESS
jgi:hypothetical protein